MNKYYYKDGSSSCDYYGSKTLHKEDGPAIEYFDGSKCWYLNGKPHRIDGPAVEFLHHQDWFIDGQGYCKEDFDKLIREAKQLPLALRLIDPREWVRKLLEK